MADPLRIFADRWGTNLELMNSPPHTHLNFFFEEGTAPSEGYDGALAGLKLLFQGKWGNYVFQLINMFHVAERTGAKRLHLIRTDMFPFLTDNILLDGIVCTTNQSPASFAGPTMSAVWMHTAPLARLADDITPARREQLAKRYVRRLMPFLTPATDQVGPDDIVVHVRSGDIFRPGPAGVEQIGASLYIQPPLSAYVKMVERALAERRGKVIIIAENTLNPTVLPLAKAAEEMGAPVTLRVGQDLLIDICWLMAARRLAFSNGTLCIAVTLLSDHIKEGYFFRLNGTGTSLPVDFFVGDQIRKSFLLEKGEPYIPIGEWTNTPEQLQTMVTFPGSELEWMGS